MTKTKSVKPKNEMKEIIQMNNRLSLVLGYAYGLISNSSIKTIEEERKCKWLKDAIENLFYLDKTLPPMP